MKKNRKFTALIFLLFIGIFCSCKKETFSQLPKISENHIVQKDSVKKEINLDSLDKANAKEMSQDEEFWNKIRVESQDSTLSLYSEMRLDHRIFGYKNPTIKSERLLFLSVFTNDVEGNPFQCKYGSYYSTTLGDEIKLKYISKENEFIKTILLDHNKVIDTIYFERKWIEFKTKIYVIL